MPYRIYVEDPASKDGYATSLINDQEASRIINGQGRPFVQLEARTIEIYVAVKQIYKIEKAGEGEQRLAVGSRS
jgi:hypothetical protein